MPRAIASYSPIRRVSHSAQPQAGDTLYVSGQIPLLEDGELLSGTLADETNRAIDNLEATLATEGAALADVVKTSVFLINPADYAEMDTAYRARFGDPLPAREAVFVVGLPKGARVEISAIAVL